MGKVSVKQYAAGDVFHVWVCFLSRVRRLSLSCSSVVFHVFVSCFSRVRRLSFCVRQLSFMCFSFVFSCWSFVFQVLVGFLSPAKLLKLSGFVLISPHSFCFFSVLHSHFFLFSQDGNVTHNTHNIHHFTENQALGSQHSHNKTPTHSQQLTTFAQETRKCCELL